MSDSTSLSSRFPKLTSAQMRELTDYEMEAVFGGQGYGSTGPDIVVTGPSVPPPPTPGSGPGSGPPGGGSGGSGGGSGSYSTPGASSAANTFASQRIQSQATTETELYWYKRQHDALAKLYDFAKANPNATVAVGDGNSITMAQVLAAITNVSIIIANYISTNPAAASTTYRPADKHSIIYLNPLHPTLISYKDWYGDPGIDYVIFHEFGHAVNFFYGFSSSQTAANTAGASIETIMGIPLMPGAPPT